MARLSWHARFGIGSPAGIVCAVVLAALSPAPRASSYVGGLAGAYLRPPVGATAAAMGGAQSADPRYLASWWNPAAFGVYRSNRVAMGLGYRALGRTEGYASCGLYIPPRVGAGVTVLYRGDPYITGLVDEAEEELDPGSYTTVTAKVALGYYLTRRISAGINLGVFYQNMTAYYDESGGVDNETAFSIGNIDAAVRVGLRKDLTASLLLRNLSVPGDTSSQWQFGNWGAQSEAGTYAPTVTGAVSYTTSLLGRPFLYNSDITVYAFDYRFRGLPRTSAVFSNGVEWQGWDTFYLRGGIGDITVDSDLLGDTQRYGRGFSMRVTAGCMIELSNMREGMRLNYNIATNKTLAGVNQQIDVVYDF